MKLLRKLFRSGFNSRRLGDFTVRINIDHHVIPYTHFEKALENLRKVFDVVLIQIGKDRYGVDRYHMFLTGYGIFMECNIDISYDKYRLGTVTLFQCDYGKKWRYYEILTEYVNKINKLQSVSTKIEAIREFFGEDVVNEVQKLINENKDLNEIHDIEVQVFYDYKEYPNFYLNIFTYTKVAQLYGTLMLVFNAFEKNGKTSETAKALEKIINELKIDHLNVNLVRPM